MLSWPDTSCCNSILCVYHVREVSICFLSRYPVARLSGLSMLLSCVWSWLLSRCVSAFQCSFGYALAYELPLLGAELPVRADNARLGKCLDEHKCRMRLKKLILHWLGNSKETLESNNWFTGRWSCQHFFCLFT